MANLDHPNGFAPYGAPKTINSFQTAAAQTIAVGDMVTLDASGYVTLATPTSDNLLGIAASSHAASTEGDTIYVYSDPRQKFVGQCSGSFAITMKGAEVDLEGTTGIQEVNENAVLKRVLRIVDKVASDEVGANASVVVAINKHVLDRDIDGATSSFGAAGLKTDVVAEFTSANGVAIDGMTIKDSVPYCDTIAEKTGATGVTVDGVLLKDGGIVCADAATLEVDTINEATAAAGVTIDGVLLKDSVPYCDTISEKTGATGVTVDSVLLKDGSIVCVDGGSIQVDTVDEATAANGVLVDGVRLKDNGLVATAAIDIDSDAAGLRLGDDQGVSLVAGAANLTIDNTRATGKVIAMLGTDTSATEFAVQNNSAASVLQAKGDLSVACAGDFSYAGHKDGQILLSSVLLPVSGAGFGQNANGSLTLANNISAATATCKLSGLKVGDEIVSFRVLGALGATGGSATVLDADLRRNSKGAGAVSDASLGAIIQVSVTADTALDAEKGLDPLHTVVADSGYYVLLTGTTAADAACDIAICGVELTINRK